MTCCSTFDGYIWHLLICLISHWSTYLQKARFFASYQENSKFPAPPTTVCFVVWPILFFSKCHTNNPDIQQCDIYLCLFYYLWSDIRIIMSADFECVQCNCRSISEKWLWSVIKSDIEMISYEYDIYFRGRS